MNQHKYRYEGILYIIAAFALLAALIASSSCKKSMSSISTPPPVQDTDVNTTVNGDTTWEIGR